MRKLIPALVALLGAVLFIGSLALGQNIGGNGIVGITAPVSLSSLATQSANTVLANATGSTAVPTAVSMPSCTAAELLWTGGTGFGCGKVTLTQPATGSTLTIADGKTLTINNTMTFAGGDLTSIAFPNAAATMARTDAANTFTGVQTFSSPTVVAGTTAADQAAAGKVGEYQEVQCLTATSGANISFTSASPTVGTWSSPPWTATNVSFGSFACPFNITANAPTPLSTATNYWAVPINATTFNVATSAANAAAGTFANTSGTSSTANLTSNVALSTTAGLSGAVLNLTAGDWDCVGSVQRTLGATTSITNMKTGINSSSTAIGSLGTYADLETAANVMTATNNPVQDTPRVRVNISSTTAEYLVGLDTFTASSNAISGDFNCRRMR